MALWVAAVICHCHLGVIHWYITGAAQVFRGGWNAAYWRALRQPAASYWAPRLPLGLSFLI